MKCDKNKVLISRYLDGKLSSHEEARLLTHFESCPECKKYFVQLKAVAQLMPDLSENAPAELKDNVLSKIKALEPSEKTETRRVHFPYFTAAAAACIMIFALIGGHILNSPKSDFDTLNSAENAKMAKQSKARSDPSQESSFQTGDSGGAMTESATAANDAQSGDDGSGGENGIKMTPSPTNTDFYSSVPIPFDDEFAFLLFAKMQDDTSLNKFLAQSGYKTTLIDGYTYAVVPSEQKDALAEKLSGMGAQIAYGAADKYKVNSASKTGLLILWTE